MALVFNSHFVSMLADHHPPSLSNSGAVVCSAKRCEEVLNGHFQCPSLRRCPAMAGAETPTRTTGNRKMQFQHCADNLCMPLEVQRCANLWLRSHMMTKTTHERQLIQPSKSITIILEHFILFTKEQQKTCDRCIANVATSR